MIHKFKHSINYIATQVGMVSLILGIICLLLFKNSSDTGFIGIGYFLTLSITSINALLLLLILANILRNFKDYQEHLQPIVLILLNIPLVCIYLEIV